MGRTRRFRRRLRRSKRLHSMHTTRRRWDFVPADNDGVVVIISSEQRRQRGPQRCGRDSAGVSCHRERLGCVTYFFLLVGDTGAPGDAEGDARKRHTEQENEVKYNNCTRQQTRQRPQACIARANVGQSRDSATRPAPCRPCLPMQTNPSSPGCEYLQLNVGLTFTDFCAVLFLARGIFTGANAAGARARSHPLDATFPH